MTFWKRNTGAVALPTGSLPVSTDETQQLRQRVRELEAKVSELCRAEQLSTERHQQYRSIFERSLDAVILTDRFGKITGVNPAAERVSGYSAAELCGRNIAQLCAPDRVTATLQAFHETLLGATRLIDTAFITKDGARVDVLATGGPLTAGGTVTGIFAILCSITERRRLEEAFRLLEREWQATFDAMSDGVCLLSPQGTILRCNKAMADFLESCPGELIGQPCFKVVHQANELIPECPLRRIQHTRQRESAVVQIGPRWMNLVCDPLWDEEGELVGVIHRVTDITEQRRLELDLAEKEERWRALMDNVPTPVQGYRLDGTVIYWNAASERTYGFTAREAMGKNLADLIIPAEMLPLFRAELANAAQLSKSGEYRPACDVVLRHKDGHPVHVHSTYTAVCVPQREPLLFCLDLDLSARRQVEEELRSAQQTLEQRVSERTAELTRVVAALQDEVKQRLEMENSLRESEERYRLLFESSSEAMYIADCATMQIEAANQAAAALHGCTRDEMLRKFAGELAGDPDKMRACFAQMCQTGRLEPAQFRQRVVRQDGTMVLVEVVGAVFHSKGRLKLIAAVRDVTQRQRLEREVMEISDRERRRIGQDLQESVCQQMVGVSLLAKALTDKLKGQGTEGGDEAAEIAALVSRALEETRGLVRALLPVDLKAHTLVPSLQELAALAHRLSRVHCVVEASSPLNLVDEMAANQLFRIAQEAVSNAIRQGHAKHIWIRVVSTPSATTLTVRDDGEGYVKNEFSGMSRHILQHRAEIMGGSLELQRHGNRGGATLTCTCPASSCAPQTGAK